MIRSLCVVALLFLATSSGGVALAQESAAPLRFQGWELPARATVTQERLKKGKEATLRYRIELAEVEEGGELRLSFDEVEFLELDGHDLTAPDASPLAKNLAAQFRSAIPPMRISREGEYLGLVDYEAHIERTLALIEQASGRPDPQRQEQMKRMMLQPQTRAMLEAKAGEMWQVWVQAWIGADLSSGEVVEGVTAVPMGAEQVEASLVLEHQGTTEDGALRLAMTTVLEGEEARAAFVEMMLAMTREGPRPMSREELAIEEFTRRSVAAVVTDPQTLRPREASVEARGRFSMADRHQEQVERDRYTFAWD